MAVDYELLTPDTVASYIAGQPHLADKVDLDTIEVAEVGDGNLNLVFVVHDANNGGVCLKQSLPYVRLVGEAWPLTPKRIFAEARGLQAGAAATAHLVPKFYGLDGDRNILAMENLRGWGMWRDRLNHGEVHHGVPAMLGEYVAAMCWSTSLFSVDQQAVKQLAADAINPELCQITEDLVFTEPYIEHDNNEFVDEVAGDVAKLRANEAVRARVGELKYTFMTEAEMLIHGDLHTGSVMVRQPDSATAATDSGDATAECRIIDAEFCFYGPVAFDLGAAFGNFLAARARAAVLDRPAEFQHYLDTAINQMWDAFTAGMRHRWHEQTSPVWTEQFLERWLSRVGHDAVGFAACKAIRRMIGLAKVTDIETLPSAQHVTAKRLVLDTATRWLSDTATIATPTDMMDVFHQVRAGQ